jgi:DNA-binding FadR family transcriptional regulator
VTKKQINSPIDAAAAKLRTIALDAADGALIGSEESLVARLGVSRATVRQVARLLEREGLLRVRRGINGGYFAARPDETTIENAVSAYLDTLDMDPEDITTVASVLWIETMRKAASLRTEQARELARSLHVRVASITSDTAYLEIADIEKETRDAIFALIKGRYIELIFHINIAFARRQFPFTSSALEDAAAHRDFVETWRDAKLLELTAIMDGDPELAMMAARHSRNLWQKRVWERGAGKTKGRRAKSG